MVRLYICFILICCVNDSSAQKTQIDYYLDQFSDFEYSDSEKAKAYLDSANTLAPQESNLLTLGRLELYRGWYLQDIGQFDSSRYHFFQSLDFFKKTNSYNDIADAYGNIGNAYADVENFREALDYQMKSIDLNEKILLLSKDSSQREMAERGRAYAWSNLSSVFFSIGEFEKSLSYQKKGLAFEERRGDTLGMGISYVGMSSIFDDLDQVDSSIYYAHLAEEIFKSYNYSTGLMSTYVNLYNYYRLKGELKIEYLYKARDIAADFNDPYGAAVTLKAMVGSDYPFPRDSMDGMIAEMKILMKENDFEDFMFSFYKSEAIYLNSLGMHEAAYEALFKFTEFDEEYKKRNDRIDFKSAEVKQELQLQLFSDSLKYQQSIQEQQLKSEKRSNRQRIFITIATFGALVLLAVLISVNRSLKVKKKNNLLLSEKNDQIQSQKTILELKNKAITDSITYAKRLQTAILPPQEELSNYFSDAMVLYLPKDVVSGDFYWFEKKGDDLFIACADCTGHGVPGAMVSVVCSNALNRCVNEFELIDPAEILNKTRELVIRTFSKSGRNVKDGMDIALCNINLQKMELVFAGANNPLWIKRVDADSIEVLESDKQPVGLYEGMTAFNAKKTVLHAGDQLYLFTDGYADQFGGEKGKKLKYKPFQNLLLENQSKPLHEQLKLLQQSFESWRGSNEQIDDVCIVSVRI